MLDKHGHGDGLTACKLRELSLLQLCSEKLKKVTSFTSSEEVRFSCTHCTSYKYIKIIHI